MDIDLDIPNNVLLDVNGLDIQLDFQRDESVGSFVTRTGFNFGMTGGKLRVTFRVEDGAGGYTTVNSGNVYSIPNDNTFRTYRFFYLPTLGQAELQVNGATVWSYKGIAGRNMHWSGGDLRIGDNMDGSGNNRTVFDNLVIGNVIASPLPVEMISFTGEAQNETVELNWTTASETNNSHFIVQKSTDGIYFDETYDYVKGAGNSASVIDYKYVDNAPENGENYYRLEQVDFDGKSYKTDVIMVYFENTTELVSHVTGQNELTVLSENVETVMAYDLSGTPVKTTKSGNKIIFDSNVNGILVLHIATKGGKVSATKIYL